MLSSFPGLSSGISIFKPQSLGRPMLGDHQHWSQSLSVLCSTGRTLMRLTWFPPRRPMSSARRLSYPSMRKGWRGILTPQRMMTKKMIGINFLEYQPLSHLTVGFRWGKKEFYLSWHHKGGLRSCPLKSQCSFSALQQPKCFKAVPCCIVCTPIPVAGKESQCFRAPVIFRRVIGFCENFCLNVNFISTLSVFCLNKTI